MDDASAEARILAKLKPFVRKATRRELKAARAAQQCRAFMLSGSCGYGMRCKFAHATKGAPTEAVLSGAVPVVDADADDEAPAAAHIEGEEDALLSLTKCGSVIDRYYSRRYAVDWDGERGRDFYVHEHTNHMMIVGLAPSHPIVRGGLVVRAIRYAPAQDLPAAAGGLRRVRVSGKRKRGAPNVDPNTVLATALTEGGGSWPLFACQAAQVRGALVLFHLDFLNVIAIRQVVEVNKRLDTEPDLLRTSPASLGWLAIMQPRPRVQASDNEAMLLGASDYALLNAARGELPVPIDVASAPVPLAEGSARKPQPLHSASIHVAATAAPTAVSVEPAASHEPVGAEL